MQIFSQTYFFKTLQLFVYIIAICYIMQLSLQKNCSFIKHKTEEQKNENQQ